MAAVKSGFTLPQELKQRLTEKFERGELLKSHFAGSFPLRCALKHPRSADIKRDFAACRAWALNWQQEGVQLELTAVSTQLTKQELPGAVIFPTLKELCAYLRRTTALRQALTAHELIAAQLPELLPLVEQRPLLLMKNAQDMPGLIRVLKWFKAHPRPDVYERTIALPGLDSKFIERHREPLRDFLDALLPPAAVNAKAGNFAERYFLKREPQLMRFHLLDKSLPANGVFNEWTEILLDAASFARLRFEIDRVVVTENKVNYLALPELPRALAVFGKGYGFTGWPEFACLKGRRLIYWGDLDSQGFEILNQLRLTLPDTEVVSVLMDVKTMEANLSHAVFNKDQKPKVLTGLTAAEQEAYQAILQNRYRPQLRIEQEFIPFEAAQQALRAALDS